MLRITVVRGGMLLAAVLVGTFGLSISSNALTDRVEVQPVSSVAGKHIKLGDIANLSGDLEFVTSATDIFIGNAPGPGKVRTLSRSQITARLKQHGIDMKAVQLACPKEVTVEADFHEYTEGELGSIVTKHIYATMPWREEQVSIGKLMCKPVRIPAIQHSYRVETQPDEDYTGRFAAEVCFYSSGKLIDKTDVSAYITVIAPVVVLQRRVERHEELEAGDVRLEEQDITNVSKNTATRIEDIIGMRACNRLSAGTVLKRDMVEHAPVITKGSIVMLCVENDAMKITTPGQALQDGSINDIIRVTNLSSQRQVYGFVQDGNTVQVRY